jgi:hypothetical protein
VKLLYAFRDIIKSGARFTLGSDAPVEDMNPLSGFFAAITRLAPDGTSPHGQGGWYVNFFEYKEPMFSTTRRSHDRFPEQRLTREEALQGALQNMTA